MTDSSNPRSPKSSRKRPSREPATIDLKATVIDDGAAEEGLARDGAPAESPPAMNPEETLAAAAAPPPEDVVASSEATLDSGAGADSLPPEASLHHAAGQDAVAQDKIAQDAPVEEPAAREAAFREASAQDPLTESAPPPAAPERRGSAGALIGAGLLGGLVGAGLVYGLQTWQAPQAQDDPRIAQLEQRVNTLRQAPQQPSQPAANTQALEQRLQALEAARGSLDQRLEALQGSADKAASQAQEALNRPPPEAPPAPPQNEAALNDLSGRLSALEEQVRNGAQSAAAAAGATQDLDRRIADLDRRFGEQDRRSAEADRRFADAEKRFADDDRRLGDLDQRLAALSQQVTQNSRSVETTSQTGTRVVLAGRLTDALRSGAPYAEVLDGVKKTGMDASRMAPLEPFAAQGAPTAAALAQSFEPLETAILRESRGPADNWTDKLLRMADRVVTVRPVNEAGSTGVPSLVARIRQALERGDVVEAAAAWDALPEPARRLSEDWGRQAKAVAQARQAAQAISAEALATLNRSTQ